MDPGVRAVILFAAPARPHIEELAERARAHVARNDQSAELWRGELAPDEHILAESKRADLRPDDVIVVSFVGLLGPLPFETRAVTDDVLDRGIPGSYMLDVRDYHPDAIAKQLNLPMLVLQGGHDIEVAAADFATWKAALSRNPRVTFHFYPDLTHAFSASVASPTFDWWYADGAHVDARVVADIAAWVNAL